MRTKWMLTTLAILTIFSTSCVSGDSKDSAKLEDKETHVEKVVIGYIPTWVDMRETIDNTDLNILTHIPRWCRKCKFAASDRREVITTLKANLNYEKSL